MIEVKIWSGNALVGLKILEILTMLLLKCRTSITIAAGNTFGAVKEPLRRFRLCSVVSLRFERAKNGAGGASELETELIYGQVGGRFRV